MSARGRPARYWVLGAFNGAVLLFILAPLVIVVVNSFSSVAYNVFPPPGLSLRWYRHLLEQDAFIRAFWRSVWVALASTAVALVAGVMASLALVRYRLPGAGWLQGLLLSPIVVPKMVLGVAVFMLFVRVGLFGDLKGVVLAHALVSMPFVIAVISANLRGLDRSLEEAAMDLGAGPVTTFFRIVLPQLRAGMLVSALFAFIVSFDQVEMTLFLVRPSYFTLPLEMMVYLEKWQDPTIAALSTLLILFSAALVAVLGFALRGTDVIRSLRQAQGFEGDRA